MTEHLLLVDDGEQQEPVHFWRKVYQSMVMSKFTGQHPLSWPAIFFHLQAHELCTVTSSEQFLKSDLDCSN